MVSSPSRPTSQGSRPRIESNLSRCASVLLSVMSLAATTSTSAVPCSCWASKAR
ncbi:Uncharacterised protein [Mycobacterium tuberculosis]|nr:Uncharacterised protein [Mycobacterium tuberculosis]